MLLVPKLQLNEMATMIASYKSVQLAKRRRYGTFKVIDCQLELYNNSGKGMGPKDGERYKMVKERALEDFRWAFEQFKDNLSRSWDVRGCLIFGDADT